MPVTTIPADKIDTNGHRFLWGDKGLEVLDSGEGEFRHVSSMGSSTCGRCGEYLRLRFEGDMLVAKIEGPDNSDLSVPCACPDDLETVTVLHVPSGRLIVDDSLRDVYNPDFKDVDYNSAMGQAEAVRRNAEAGCAYGPVLNTSPGLYKTPTGYAIANTGWDDETCERLEPEGWTELARVCTDLWAYSIADYQDFLDKGGKPIEEEDNYGSRSVVEVEPGDYEFTLYTGRADFDCHGEGNVVFATIKKIA